MFSIYDARYDWPYDLLHSPLLPEAWFEDDEEATATRFPTGVQEVLEPMTRACEQYIKEFFAKRKVAE